MSSDFYALLSHLFDEMTLAPGIVPDVPIQKWLPDSPEYDLLERLQRMFLAWHIHQTQTAYQSQQHIEAQLQEQATQRDISQTVAVLEERQRLAQNLHDAVNQSLFSAGLIAEVLPRLWERNPVEARRSLEDLRRLTRGALAEMRGLLGELQPLILTDTELGDLLHQLGSALTGRTNVPVKVTVEGEGILPADVQVVLYRLCQEGLNNIAKHAKAAQVTIHLKHILKGVVIRIHDDGRGFEPERIAEGHYGLSIMHQRAEAIGASLTIASQPGQGTEITIDWTETPAEKRL